jgi:oligoendopeptidase F
MTNPDSCLRTHNRELEKRHVDRAEASWMAATTGAPEWVKKAAETQIAWDLYCADRERFAEVSQLLEREEGDELQRRQLEHLHRSFLPNQIPEEDLKAMAEISTRLKHTFNTHRARLEGNAVSDNEIRRILTESTDSTERKAAWEASKTIGAKVEAELLDLVRKRNAAARALGFDDHHAMAYHLQELDRDFVFATFERLKELTDESFRGLKDEIDDELIRRFNCSRDDLRPWHYADPFFQEAPPSADIDFDSYYRGANLEKLTADTFARVGLDITDILERSDLYPRDGKNQHAFCTHIDRRGDIRVLCNNAPNHHWMMVMLHEFGHAIYDKHLDPDLPFLLRRPAHTLTTEGIAMLFGRLNKTTAWLTRFAGVSEKEADMIAKSVRRTLRRQMLVAARWILTMTFFERELYRDPDQDLNRLWWKLAADIQRVNPPENTAAPHWAAKIHFTLAPVYYQNYLLGELTASQLSACLEREVSPDFFRRETGDFLRERFFQPGARHHWNQKLELATGEPLDPRHFIGQFVEAEAS